MTLRSPMTDAAELPRSPKLPQCSELRRLQPC
jgi:hypothetical protein